MPARFRRPALGAVIGLLAVCAALAAGEVAAIFLRPAASPIIAVGNRFILLTPESLKRTAIKQFGTNDKTALLAGIYLVIAAFAIVLGTVMIRHRRIGLAGIAFFGLVGAWAALTTHAHQGTDFLPSVIAALAGIVVANWLLNEVGVLDKSPAAALLPNRRRFLQRGVAVAGGAALAGFGGRAIQHNRFDAARARAATVLPPTSPASAVSSGPAPSTTDPASVNAAAGATKPGSTFDLGQGSVAFQTSSDRFYRIDTALTVPQLNPKTWQLRIHGMVAKELKISYQDLIARPLIERWLTLCCVSNEIGGDLIGTALFRGVLLAEVLKEAGLDPAADQLVASSSDGMTIGSPTAVVLDGRDAMLAVGMNGEVLPVEHGFPVRMVVPGLYGYVSACKWIVDLEATTFAANSPYWVQRGWAPQAPVLLAARIDTPKTGKHVAVGSTIPIAGIAWDQHVGVSKVEVQVDNGPWTAARLAEVPSTDTWRQWVLPWQVSDRGAHTLRVRAYDSAGKPQDTQVRDPFPSGARGLHTVSVTAN